VSLKFLLVVLLGVFSLPVSAAAEEPLYVHRVDRVMRWSSPENPRGEPGRGARENAGAKGRAFVPLPAGATHRLLDVQGSGVVTRIWLTVSDRSPEMLRSLKLEIFWDGADKPAVAAPLGDFFGVGLGRTAKFHHSLLASPEGRSFLCFIPMPYREAARIQLTNESAKPLTHLFFDVDFVETPEPDKDALYFHAHWRRERATRLGADFELLPRVAGRGRFLGVNVGVKANPRYEKTWWGEGEVKVYLDDDREFPTLAGTGTEDYIGSGWGQGEFCMDTAGCLVADAKNREWAFYRFHLPDPIFFRSSCRVTLQQIGGAAKAKVRELQQAGVPLIPVTLDEAGQLHHLYREGETVRLGEANLPDGWVNFYRSDDVSATAYFYLDAPSSELPELQPVTERVPADGE
jgi:hypothetical protein